MILCRGSNTLHYSHELIVDWCVNTLLHPFYVLMLNWKQLYTTRIKVHTQQTLLISWFWKNKNIIKSFIWSRPHFFYIQYTVIVFKCHMSCWKCHVRLWMYTRVNNFDTAVHKWCTCFLNLLSITTHSLMVQHTKHWKVVYMLLDSRHLLIIEQEQQSNNSTRRLNHNVDEIQ